MKQESRLQEKLKALKLTSTKTQASIEFIWDCKLAKLQHFAWQVASGGLFTDNRAMHMDHPGRLACVHVAIAT